MVDRSAFDRIIQAGGYIVDQLGGAPDANAIPIAKATRRRGDGRRRVHRLWRVRGGLQERLGRAVHVGQDHPPRPPAAGPGRAHATRASAMVEQMDAEGFGTCSNEGECEAVCPKGISIRNIARMNRDFLKAQFAAR